MKIEKGTNKGRSIHHITVGNIKLSALMAEDSEVRHIDKVTIQTKEPEQKLVIDDPKDCMTIVRGLISLDASIENIIRGIVERNVN